MHVAGPAGTLDIDAVVDTGFNGERLHFHSLRHSCGAWFASKGVSEKITQEILGHASSRTTQVYSHVASSALEGAMEKAFGN